ncbi:MAG: hypothetical protein IJ660_00980 [Alphaproteobacteria bacterium]|jgi:hypothetical protein|nr:hypothetical protein [Alphaproteobacteria bacterium]
MDSLTSSPANRELIRLFLEASGLVIKLTHKLENANIPDSDLHLAAARDFIHRNQLYNISLGVIAKDMPED